MPTTAAKASGSLTNQDTTLAATPNSAAAKLTADLTDDEEEDTPIILSRAGWASSHPGLLNIIEKHKSAFSKEREDAPRKEPHNSSAVNLVIQELAQNYKPTILLETSEEPSTIQHTQLPCEEIVPGGKFHGLMTKKVLECFERAIQGGSDELLESPPPKAFPISQSPSSAHNSPANSTAGGVKRVLPTTRTTKQQAVSTPVRAGAKHDLSAEKTPIAGNKKLRQQLRDVVLPRSASRRASIEAKRMMEELPTSSRRYVRVDQLAYDWSGLNIDGAAAWNRFLRERNDPKIELQPRVVSAMDTYQLVQSVKAGLATVTPPPGSYLYEALAEDFDAEEEEESAETPKARLMSLFRKMADYETSEASRRKHEYQLMKEDEIQDYLVEIEKDIRELDEIESQLEDDELSGADAYHSPARLPKTDEATMKNVPVFWQRNFSALFENKGTATRYLMPQDQF